MWRLSLRLRATKRLRLLGENRGCRTGTNSGCISGSGLGIVHWLKSSNCSIPEILFNIHWKVQRFGVWFQVQKIIEGP